MWTLRLLDRSELQVQDALSRPHGDRLQFVLGTEAGMITSIVRKVCVCVEGGGGGTEAGMITSIVRLCVGGVSDR